MAVLTHSSTDLNNVFAAMQANRLHVANSDYAQRITKIRRLRDAIFKYQQDIRNALKADMNEPEAEVDLVEIYRMTSEIKHAEKTLKSMMRPQKVNTPLALIGTSSHIQYEPKGVCLLISPWNFPFDLTINPLIAAVCAGNCVVVKPSEISPNSAAVLNKIISEVFDENEVKVIEGDVSVATALLKLPFNHIFFTGAPSIGKVVMRAAAEHLASVTLELGGKSPVIVDETADIEMAARRIMGGKIIKCGQMCITPDYVFVHASKKEALVDAMKKQIERMTGKNDDERLHQGDYTRIVSDKHFQRVLSYLEDAVLKGAKIDYGATHRASERYIAPTILSNVSKDMLVMQEEIFGPLLPILTFEKLSDATTFINENHKPLSLYIFSTNTDNQHFILKNTSAGGVTINAVALHALSNELPFGGVNNSGIGKGHGGFAFKEFSNQKAVMKVYSPFLGVDMMFAPYTDKVKKLIALTIKWF